MPVLALDIVFDKLGSWFKHVGCTYLMSADCNAHQMAWVCNAQSASAASCSPAVMCVAIVLEAGIEIINGVPENVLRQA